MKRPVLVTGAHRSGTTWIGKMIAASAEVTYISEPLNVLHRPGVMRAPVDYWYQYICTENEADYLPALQDTIAFRYRLLAELRSLRSTKDAGRMLRDLSWFIQGRVFNSRPLLKDPFAVFSIPWFVEQFSAQVVVLVRHPAGFVSSLKKLDWDFDFANLLAQTYLMRDLLGDYRLPMEAALTDETDLISQGALLWKIVYDLVDRYRNEIPGLIVIRHEDIAGNPLGEYQRLFDALGLNFTEKVKTLIVNTSSDKNPVELASGKQHSVRLNSQDAIHNWKSRLQTEEIERIYQITQQVSERYYDQGDWE